MPQHRTSALVFSLTLLAVLLLLSAAGSAQPRTFCVEGSRWEALDVPPASASELTVPVFFDLGNQVLFNPERLENLMVVNASGLASPAGTDDVWVAIEESPAENTGFIESWFAPNYDAFLVRHTGNTCNDSTSPRRRLYLANVPQPDRDPVDVPQPGQEGTDQDRTQFLIESSDFVDALNLSQAPLLPVAPDN